MVDSAGGAPSVIDRIIGFALHNKLVVVLGVLALGTWGVISAPFAWDIGIPRSPVPVDAIPDIGENQQIVFTPWMGRSPQDVEDQITYPLTVSLLGIPSVKTIRSYSMFGFSTIYITFSEDVEFYWSRTRVLEKLSSLPPGTLPPGVNPALGPDATALGQVYWYTLEGRDEEGNPTGGWNLEELRSVQDWYVRYALMSAEGVAEVASIGGFVSEYQIDVDPDAMRAHRVKLEEVYHAVMRSNVDVGARSIEINYVEYIIRGLGFIETLADIEDTVVKVNDNVPIYVKDVAKVSRGPANRRGALDKAGVEAVGGVVVVRYGENPLAAIENVKAKIAEVAPGLPSKTLADGTVSRVTVVPFYDRTGLIEETLGTLNTALTQEILVTVIVVLVMVLHLKSALLISGLLPFAVLVVFIAMKQFGVDANIVALSGIAIAIGTMVDMGIVVTENILKHLEVADPEEDRLKVVYRAAAEVGTPMVTSAATTIVGFLPVFTMEAAEGKLFRPLAFTWTFALFASILAALTVLPPLAQLLFTGKLRDGRIRMGVYGLALVAGVVGPFAFEWVAWWAGALVALVGAYHLAEPYLPEVVRKWAPHASVAIAVAVVGAVLAADWLPLGPEAGIVRNVVFVAVLILGPLGAALLLLRNYSAILAWALRHKVAFLSLPATMLLLGFMVWRGFDATFGFLPDKVRGWSPVAAVADAFPGLGEEFMPPLDEGSYLYMPTGMPHASIGAMLKILSTIDTAIQAIPEVESAVGKLGRAETPLDPAPVSMLEVIINYFPEYLVDRVGARLRFRVVDGESDYFRNEAGEPVPGSDGAPYVVDVRFERDENGKLIPDPDGLPFRLWRMRLDPALNPGRAAWRGIKSAVDIWDLITAAATIPGVTSAPRLQPINARIVMLQSGMRAPMGLKILGPDLETIEKVGLDVERFLKEVPSIAPAAVVADRIVGKPYLEIDIDRKAIARYNIKVRDLQDLIEVAIGGRGITTTVEGRERYPVRIRYLRELRDSIESLSRIVVPAPDGTQVPLVELAEIRYVRGPQVIKSEDTFLVGYVLFDMKPGFAEVEVVEAAKAYLDSKIESGELVLPAGVSFKFAGSYENQVRSAKRLLIVLPLALLAIFFILFFQFKSVLKTALVFTAILVRWACGFIMLWLYAQAWFLDFAVFGTNMRELFQIHPYNMSVAVWVGFLALFGVAAEDGVILGTYLDQTFERRKPTTLEGVRAATIEAGVRRARPALMTIITTVLALVPVLTSTGRGADIMVPMAIPVFGGMTFGIITMFVVPVLLGGAAELSLVRRRNGDSGSGAEPEPAQTG